jgi:hypothetical protein
VHASQFCGGLAEQMKCRNLYERLIRTCLHKDLCQNSTHLLGGLIEALGASHYSTNL